MQRQKSVRCFTSKNLAGEARLEERIRGKPVTCSSGVDRRHRVHQVTNKGRFPRVMGGCAIFHCTTSYKIDKFGVEGLFGVAGPADNTSLSHVYCGTDALSVQYLNAETCPHRRGGVGVWGVGGSPRRAGLAKVLGARRGGGVEGGRGVEWRCGDGRLAGVAGPADNTSLSHAYCGTDALSVQYLNAETCPHRGVWGYGV
jgi:hypothetical protein